MEEDRRKICMNTYCGVRATSRWRTGWILSSGELASLCNICGTVYKKGSFCKAFHGSEDGWNHCQFCNEPIHCGCIASGISVVAPDNGGFKCRNCAFTPNDVHRDKTSIVGDMAVYTQLSDKSNDTDGDPREIIEADETDRDTGDNLPNIYMVDGIKIKAYKRPPVSPGQMMRTMSMRKKEDEEDEGDNDLAGIESDEGDKGDNDLAGGIVGLQSDPPATTKHGRHRDGCRCVVCTQHPRGNPHPQNCECRGCAIYLKRRKTTLRRRSQKKNPATASTSKRGRPKNTV